MKKLFVSLVLFASLIFPSGLVAPAFAIDPVPACNQASAPTGPTQSQDLGSTDVCKAVNKGQSGQNPFVSALKIVINIVSFIVGVAAVISIIVSGMKFVIANGDSNAVAQARGSLIYALIGIVIVVLAQSIVVFVLNKI